MGIVVYTAGMVCSCNSSGINMSHVDMLLQVILVSLGIDVKLRNLISKGPAYRE